MKPVTTPKGRLEHVKQADMLKLQKVYARLCFCTPDGCTHTSVVQCMRHLCTQLVAKRDADISSGKETGTALLQEHVPLFRRPAMHVTVGHCLRCKSVLTSEDKRRTMSVLHPGLYVKMHNQTLPKHEWIHLSMSGQPNDGDDNAWRDGQSMVCVQCVMPCTHCTRLTLISQMSMRGMCDICLHTSRSEIQDVEDCIKLLE
jgi:hypothetical protein